MASVEDWQYGRTKRGGEALPHTRIKRARSTRALVYPGSGVVDFFPLDLFSADFIDDFHYVDAFPNVVDVGDDENTPADYRHRFDDFVDTAHVLVDAELMTEYSHQPWEFQLPASRRLLFHHNVDLRATYRQVPAILYDASTVLFAAGMPLSIISKIDRVLLPGRRMVLERQNVSTRMLQGCTRVASFNHDDFGFRQRQFDVYDAEGSTWFRRLMQTVGDPVTLRLSHVTYD